MNTTQFPVAFLLIGYARKSLKVSKIDEVHNRQSSEHQSITKVSGVDEKMLRVVAGKIGKDWKKLGTFLDFETDQIYAYQSDYQNDLNEQIFQMLLGWCRRQPNQETAEDGLKKALKEIGRTDIVRILGMLYFKNQKVSIYLYIQKYLRQFRYSFIGGERFMLGCLNGW